MDGMKALKAQSAYSRPERPTNFITYALAAGLSFVGLVFLLLKAVPQGGRATAGAAVFGAGLAAVFTVGAVAHILPFCKARAALVRIVNYSEIMLLLACMFAPLSLTVLGGGTVADAVWGYCLFAVVTVCAVLVCLVSAFIDDCKIIVLFLYVAAGLLFCLRIARIAALSSLATFWLSVSGGAMYILGKIFGVWDGLPFRNLAARISVMCGAALHFVCVYLFVL